MPLLAEFPLTVSLTRAALLAEAAAMIAKGGVASVTMRAIGRRLGVSRAAPYRHFADKTALLVAVAAAGFDRLRSRLQTIEAGASRSSVERLRRMGEEYVRFALENPAHYRLMYGKEALTREDQPELREAAIALFDKARKLDPGFVEALVMAGHMRTRYANFFDTDDHDTLLDEAQDLLQTAMRLNPGDATCHMAMGRWHVVKDEPQIGMEYCREAVALNPNSVLAHFELGIALNSAGRYEEALAHYDTARRLSPRDLHAAALSTGPSFALFMLGRFEEAAANAARVSRGPNPRYWADALLVAALIRLGRKAEAEAAKAVLLERKPDFTIREFVPAQGSRRTEILLALREAGLPE